MKRIDVSKMMLWRQTRPLLERLEDRLVPGETLSALLLGAGAGWFGGSLPVPSTDSSASTESTAVLSWASTSSATAAAGSDDSTVDWGDWDSGASVAVEATSATDTTDGVTAAPESATMDQIFADDFSAGDFSSLERFTGSSSGSYESAHASAPAMMGGGGAAFTPAVNIGASVASMGGAQTMDNSGLVSLMAAQPTASVSSASTVTASPANTSVAPVSHSTSTSAVVSQAASTTAVASPASDSSEVAADPGGNMPMLTHNPSPQGSSPTGYTPQQMRHAYGFDQLTQTGAGQTIYIIDAYSQPNIASDLQTFDAQFGLPNPTLNILTPQGSARYNSGWGQEISLDVEWAHAIAPGATIDLVEAASNSNTNLYGAVDYAVSQGAHIVSMSWGGSDSTGESSLDSHFNHSGVAFFASSGDTGGKVIYPSASPYVVSTGGTSLFLSGGNYSSESAWSSGGGGVSVGESLPGYQSAYGLSYSGRATPDVAYNSDPNTGVPVYDSARSGGGWGQYGGTSAAAPQWAALAALVDQSRSTPLSSANLTSRFDYSAATGTVYASNFHDVTSGSNGFAAGTGYDLATGLGSPVANNLVPYLISH